MALSDGKKTITAVANIQGYVAEEPRGDNGFGFDEIFELEDGRTLAELSATLSTIVEPTDSAEPVEEPTEPVEEPTIDTVEESTDISM